jgi:prefoldin subunit 5
MAIDIRLYFDCTNKKTFVKDLTDYSTEIPTGVLVIGYGTLSAPNSTLIINANSINDPIIDDDDDPRISSLYNLTSPIQAGQYTFNYSNYYFYENRSEDNQFITILTNSSLLVEGEIASLFKAGDSIVINSSDESANNGTFTVVSLTNTFGNTEIVIEENTLVPLDPVANDPDANFLISTTNVIYADKIYTYSVCSSTPTPCVEFSYDCFTGAYGSGQITDATNYTGYTVETRELSAYYPNALSPAPADNPVITETAIINIGELATGTWSVKLSSTVSSEQADGLNLQSTITTLKEFNVACSSNMCGLSDCLTKLKDKHISYLRSSNISPLQQYVDNVQLLYTMAREAQACGDKNAYSDYVSQIYAVLKKTESECGCSTGSGCGCGCESGGSCGCGDQTPQWVNNIGVDINSLLEDFEVFMNDTLPSLEANIDSLNNDMEAVQEDITTLQNDVNDLSSGLSTVTTQTGNNTTSIETLDEQINDPVSGLAAQVEEIQNEITNLAASTSEVSLNELFNELPTTNQGVWKCTEGQIVNAYTYRVFISQNQTADLEVGQFVSLYNPPTQSWFTGEITASSFSAGQTQVTIDCGGISNTPCSFLATTDDFALFIKTDSSNVNKYNFRKTFYLQNDAYWKFEDPDWKYWSKLNVTFTCNSIMDISIKNNTTNSSAPPIRINPGMFIELEFIFEKQWTGSVYNTSFVGDIKYQGGSQSGGVDENNDYTFGGFYGYNPDWNHGLNLKNSGFIQAFSNGEEGSPGCVLTQDVYDAIGRTTAQREIVRYAFGPSYPLNSSTPLFFNGEVPEELIFNFLNSNITIFKFEQSFGKFPNNIV